MCLEPVHTHSDWEPAVLKQVPLRGAQSQLGQVSLEVLPREVWDACIAHLTYATLSGRHWEVTTQRLDEVEMKTFQKLI